jgi:histidyl-tRNA synthetase
MSTSSSLSTAPARGMRDMLPKETALRDWAIASLIKTYEQYGFTHIDTPAVENIAQLKTSEGGENLSLIFEILKRGDKLEKVLSENSTDQKKLIAELSDLGLRFDLTVPLVRFFAHNQAQLPYPFKSIQVGSVWRAESPQAGRYRQFTQCDIDSFGIKSEIAEMELIQATAQALLNLGFEKFTVRINDRRVLTALVANCGFAENQFDNVFIQIDKLDKIGIAGVKKELLANGHASEAVEKICSLLGDLTSKESGKTALSQIPANCDKEVITALDNVITAITKIANDRYSIVFDPTLVRGMGYYTGQIFEIVIAGATHSIAGGGRYDKMVGKFSGRDVPACGFSIGFERIISILMEKENNRNTQLNKIAVIFDQDRDQLTDVFLKANALRADDKCISLLPKKKDMRKQIDSLVEEGFTGYAPYHPEKEKLEVKLF